MQPVLPLLKAIGDEGRVRILVALRERELCVCQLTALLGLATSTVSEQLARLRRAGLVATRRRGKWVFCRRPMPGGDPGVDATLAYLDQVYGESRQAWVDDRRLSGICAVRPETLCRTRNGATRGA